MQPSGLDPRQVEQVVDHSQQRLGTMQHAPQVLAHALGYGFLKGQFGETDDGIERRAYLMAHVGEKHALGPTRLFGPLVRRGEFGLCPVAFERGAENLAGGLEKEDVAPLPCPLRAGVVEADEAAPYPTGKDGEDKQRTYALRLKHVTLRQRLVCDRAHHGAPLAEFMQPVGSLRRIDDVLQRRVVQFGAHTRRATLIALRAAQPAFGILIVLEDIGPASPRSLTQCAQHPHEGRLGT